MIGNLNGYVKNYRSCLNNPLLIAGMRFNIVYWQLIINPAMLFVEIRF